MCLEWSMGGVCLHGGHGAPSFLAPGHSTLLPSSLQPVVNAKQCLHPHLCLDQAPSREAYTAARREVEKSLGTLQAACASAYASGKHIEQVLEAS